MDSEGPEGTPFPAILYMKVGFHVDETLVHILARKAREEREAGVLFWGYGGTLCHPTRQVQPFARGQGDLPISIVLSVTPSRFTAVQRRASEYSTDGDLWRPLPVGVSVTGSAFALVCRSLRPASFALDLARYEVAVGPSAGRSLAAHVRHRVDKACATRVRDCADPPRPVEIRLTAELVPPFAVLLR
jgi:hypothetical protein